MREFPPLRPHLPGGPLVELHRRFLEHARIHPVALEYHGTVVAGGDQEAEWAAHMRDPLDRVDGAAVAAEHAQRGTLAEAPNPKIIKLELLIVEGF